MRITLAILFIFLVAFCASRATAQNIRFSGQHVELKKAFAAIEAQTGYTVIWSTNLQKSAKLISVEVRNMPLLDFLNTILKDQLLTYRLNKKTIFLFKKNDSQVPVDLKSTADTVKKINIHGSIVNESGERVMASVIVKGTSNGTSSNVDGFFELTGVEENATLQITGANIEAQEIKITGRTTLNITAKIKISEQQAVTVSTGYWTTTKRNSTSTIAKITAKDIEKQPVMNPLQALQGRLSGVYVTQQSGLPNSDFTIRIRGKNSLRSDPEANAPLFVVDGVPYTNTTIKTSVASNSIGATSPLNSIDPASIESIEVLKDSDATAVYGSQGANGVILITTKKGKAGKTSTSFNFSAGFAQVPHFIKLLNTQQYLEMRREAYANDGITTYPVNAYDVNGKWDTTRYTNWQKVLMGGTAQNQKADASISGGTATTRFLLRGFFSKQTTVFPGDFAYKRGAGHFNLNHESLNKKFQLGFTADFSGDNNTLPDVGGGNTTLVIQSFKLAPNAPRLYNNDGKFNWENSTWTNPLAQLLNKYEGKTQNFFVNNTFSYEFLAGLKVKTNVGYNTLQMNELATYPIKSQAPNEINKKGSASFGTSGTDTWVIEPQLEFTKKIGIGELTSLLGTTWRESNQKSQVLVGFGYTTDALLEDLYSAPNVVVRNFNKILYRYNAIYGRINYNIKQKYIVNLTARRDGSSRFGPNKKFGNFGAIGAAWIFSDEPFFRDHLPFISFGKLRSSIGTTGNDQIRDYEYLETYSPARSYQSSGNSIVPSRIANPDYSWEVNKKFEAALELGLLQDRVQLGINFYRNECSNQLVGESIPAISGFLSFQNNFPATVRNQGWEFEVSTTNIKGRLFRWTSAFNLTIPTNKLVAYPNIEKSLYAYVYKVGESIFKTRRTHYWGVDPTAGVYQFEDIDNDGNPFSDLDKQILVKVGQDYYGGLQNTLTYGGFELSFFLQFTKQTGTNYLQALSIFDVPGTSGNQPAFVMNRWREPGQVTSIQKFTTNKGTDAGAAYLNGLLYPTDFTVSDASFIRLQNASLTWRIPSLLIKKIGLAEASIFVLGQNLFTITNYYGFDPQVDSFGLLPSLRVITIGARISL